MLKKNYTYFIHTCVFHKSMIKNVCFLDNPCTCILFNEDVHVLVYIVSENETSTSPLYYTIVEIIETQGCDSNLCHKVIFLGCQMTF